MPFHHGLKIGDVVSQKQLSELFVHNINSGMKYSSKTQTIVLVNELSDTVYHNRWEDGFFYYTGSGKKGNQSLTSRNKRLSTSVIDGNSVYLINGIKGKYYIFMGQFKLSRNPFQEEQYDEDKNLRTVWVFPLTPLDNQNNFKLPSDLIDEAEKRIIIKMKGVSIKELEDRAKKAHKFPRGVLSYGEMYHRDAYVTEYAKRRANGVCELCENLAPFKNKNNQPYLETHHIVWLSKGGEDSIENTVALCPNCHKKMHIRDQSEDVEKLRKEPKYIRGRKSTLMGDKQ